MSGRIAGLSLCGDSGIEHRFRRELARQRVRPLGDIARAKEDNVIAGLGEGADERGQILRPFQAERMAVSPRLQGGDERIAIGACDGRFARRINIGDDHRIGIVERARKTIEERMETRIAMRLHDGDDSGLGGRARGTQNSGDFDRMVAIIVENGCAVPIRRCG